MRLATFVLCFATLSFGLSKGTFTSYTTTWNGFTRTYAVYVPNSVAANPALVLVLHPTKPGLTPPAYFASVPWKSIADLNGFIVTWPISTYNTRAQSWFWDALILDFAFPVLPDDAGFLRRLIIDLEAQYPINPGQVFVTGFSSGAFMTHALGAQSADLIAAINPVAGQVYAEKWGMIATMPPPSRPVSVLDVHGDADPNVPYCGGKRGLWGERLNLASLDETVGYWINADICSDSVPQFCSNGQPTTAPGLAAISCANNTEVDFIRRVGGGHAYPPDIEATAWQFFASHGR